MRIREKEKIGLRYADDDFMDLRTASRYLMWSTKYTRLLIQYDLIPYKKEGRRFFLKKKDLDGFTNECRRIRSEEADLMWKFLEWRSEQKGRKSRRWNHSKWIEYMLWKSKK